MVNEVDDVATVNLNTMFVSPGEFELIGSWEPVRAEVGDDVILPCHVRPEYDMTALTVEWKCQNAVVHMYKSRKDNLDSQDKKFKGRTSLFTDEMTRGNVSLKLTKVTEEDTENCTCYVPRLHSKVRRGYVTLIVGEYR